MFRAAGFFTGLPGMPGAEGLKLSADGTKLLLLARKDVPPGLAQCAIQVRDAATGLLLHATQFDLHGFSDRTSAGFIRYLAYAFSPDGSEVMIGGEENGSAYLLSTSTGALVRGFVGHLGAVNSVAFWPTARWFLPLVTTTLCGYGVTKTGGY